MNKPTIVCISIAILLTLILFIYKRRFHTKYLKLLFRFFSTFLLLYLLIQFLVFIRWEYFVPSNTSNDTAINFAFLTGAVFSFTISFVILLIDFLIKLLRNKKT